MQAGQYRFVAVGAADFDGVMLGAAIIGAEDVQTSGFGCSHRQAGRDHRGEGGKAVKVGAIGIGEQRQVVAGGQRQPVGNCNQQHCGQQLRGFRQGNRGAVQRGRAIAQRHQRAFHRHVQIVGWVSHRAQPAQIGLVGHAQAGEVVVIGNSLQRLGAAGGQRQFGGAFGAQGGKAIMGQLLDRGAEHGLAAARQNDGQAKPQVSAGAGKDFGGGGAQAHAGYIGDTVAD